MSLTLIEVRELIFEIESNYDVDSWEINGVKIWPLIRIKLNYFLSYEALEVNINDSIQKRSKIELITQVISGPFKWAYYLLKDWKKNQSIFKECDVILMGSPGGNIKINNEWYDKFCDPISQLLNENGFRSLRLDTSHKHYTPRANPSFYVQTLLDLSIVYSIFTFNKATINSSLNGYEKFLNFLEGKSISLNKLNLSASVISRQVHKILILKKLYTRIIKRIKPSMVMTVCYYDDICLAFNLACHEQNILSFDIQHGVQGENHGAYGCWSKVPQKGYDLLPNYFACWSEYESNVINQWSKNISNHKPIVIGNLFLNTWKLHIKEMGKKYENRFNSFFYKPIFKILVTLGWDVSSDRILANTLSTMKILENDFYWLIRLHPSMVNQKEEIYNMLRKHNITKFEIEISSDFPLYYILSKIDLHITHSSSVTIEAREFGIPTLITSDYGWEVFKYDKRLDGYIIKCLDKSKILSTLSEFSNNSNFKNKESENRISLTNLPFLEILRNFKNGY